MTAPPPTPNSPASSPVMTPATMTAVASQSSSVKGTPRTIPLLFLIGLTLQHGRSRSRHRQRCERLAQQRRAGSWRRAGFGEPAAERPRARHALEQSVHVARDGMKPHAACKLALHIGNERCRRGARRRKWRRIVENASIDGKKPPRLLIGRAAHHDTIHPIKMRGHFGQTANPAIEHDWQPRMRRFEAIDAIVVERRNFAVLFRR